MQYYTNLFSPETYEAFSKSDRTVSGFRVRQQKAASRIKVGDRFICYMTKLSRWVGVFEVMSTSFKDAASIFYPEDDPFVIRFRVKPIAWLDKEKAIPIKDDRVWDRLSFTRGLDKKSSTWTGQLRGSLNRMKFEDGQYLEELILSQSEGGETFPIDEREYEKLITHTVRRVDKVVTVTVPKDTDAEEEEQPTELLEVRESIQVQAMLARIGATMGTKIWVPRSDRSRVLGLWDDTGHDLLDMLPLNYDETTLRTIEQIDVLWLKGVRSSAPLRWSTRLRSTLAFSGWPTCWPYNPTWTSSFTSSPRLSVRTKSLTSCRDLYSRYWKKDR